MNFADTLAATRIINGWCSNVTDGHIKDLVEESAIRDSVMIMLNAIYFDGLWVRPFAPDQTHELPFFVTPGDQRSAMYMVQTGKFYYVDSPQLNAKILRLPYAGNKFAMSIIMPNTRDGLDVLGRQLDGVAIRQAEMLMSEMDIHVSIPKFKFDHLSNMNAVLGEVIHE